MILQQGEKLHIIHRRYFEKEPRRHFIGAVDIYDAGLARVTGNVWVVDTVKFAFIKRPEKRIRIISLVSGDLLVNIIPPSVDLEKIYYHQEKKGVRVTDGTDWYLDLSEFTWM